jgi:hypothetical protein
MQAVLLGVIDATSIETAINNITEVDVPESAISLVMKDMNQARQIIGTEGPLQEVSLVNLVAKLQSLGVTQSASKNYQQLIKQGKALLAVTGDQQTLDVVKDVLHDYPHTALLEVSLT